MVFDPLPDGSVPTSRGLEAQLEPRVARVCRTTAPAPLGAAHRRALAAELGAGRALRHPQPPPPRCAAGARRASGSCSTGSATSGRTASIARGRSGSWSCSTGSEGGRWALVTKTHHCLVDGMSSVDVTRLLLDASPDPRPRRQLAPEPARRARRAIASRSACAGALVAHPRAAAAELERRTRGVVETAGARRADRRSTHEPQPADRRPPPLRGRRAPTSTTLKAVKAGLGGTLNDVVLAIATGALRAFLRAPGRAAAAAGAARDGAGEPPRGRERPACSATGSARCSWTCRWRSRTRALRYARVVEVSRVAQGRQPGDRRRSTLVERRRAVAPPAIHAVIACARCSRRGCSTSP